jgi:uncharacterized membrane protein
VSTPNAASDASALTAPDVVGGKHGADTTSGRVRWRTPAALLVLSAIPLLGGGIRLAGLAGAVEISPQNARFFAAPLPVVLHILGASLFLALGALQFVPAIRRTRPRWHRTAGRVLVASGLVAALSGLWMTQFYPRPVGNGDLLYAFRLLFGSGMAVSVVLGFVAIRRKEIGRHRAWMMRAYAIGLGAGTQALALIGAEIVVGPPGEILRALLMGASWAINLAIAEWLISGRPMPTRRSRASRASRIRPVPQSA